MTSIYDFVMNHPVWSLVIAAFALAAAVAAWDVLQKRHAILHNFPVVGHFRYFLEAIGPELRQYWVANDKEEKPFNRSERSWIYASSKGQNSNTGFGTTEVLYQTGYPIIKHATFPYPESNYLGVDGDDTAIPCMKVMGAFHGRAKAFRPRSIINISAMSFGSLGERAVSSMNKGAKAAGCMHNTGEGGFSPYHDFGADVMLQIGTGYFGCRDEHGAFELEKLVAKCQRHPEIKCIEIKLSQGAKPGKGGILPGSKVTPEIAEIRGVPVGKTVYSPNSHREFSTVDEAIDFVEKIGQATGLPVGIKSAIGEHHFWQELADRMVARGEGPDFISVDGGEGGTGAAPLAFADHVALPFKIGFARVYQIFQAAGAAGRVVWVGSGKLGFPDRAIVAMALGCDLIGIAREAMIAIGCIQAQRCHKGDCPAGIATQNKWLQGGVNIEHKAQRMARYVRSFRKELLVLTFAAGYEHPAQFIGDDIELSTGVNRFSTLTEVMGYRKDAVTKGERDAWRGDLHAVH